MIPTLEWRTSLVSSLFESHNCALKVAVLHLPAQIQHFPNVPRSVVCAAKADQKGVLKRRVLEKIRRMRGPGRYGGMFFRSLRHKFAACAQTKQNSCRPESKLSSIHFHSGSSQHNASNRFD